MQVGLGLVRRLKPKLFSGLVEYISDQLSALALFQLSPPTLGYEGGGSHRCVGRLILRREDVGCVLKGRVSVKNSSWSGLSQVRIHI